jgi:hypothetical protein
MPEMVAMIAAAGVCRFSLFDVVASSAQDLRAHRQRTEKEDRRSTRCGDIDVPGRPCFFPFRFRFRKTRFDRTRRQASLPPFFLFFFLLFS